MKSILISIKPEWVAKILNGEKTIEIRKTCPTQLRGDTPVKPEPIDVYIYCSKGKSIIKSSDKSWCIKDKNFQYDGSFNYYSGFNGKVVAKFTLNKVEELKPRIGVFWVWGGHPYYTDNVSEENLLKRSHLLATELDDYLKGKKGYAWHIDNLEIFDRPKELSEFYCRKYLKRPPESWCYVEVE